MASELEYRRLPGKQIGIVRKASLWEGKDHLLSVSGTRFVENYRRFFYRDIQAIIVRRCVRFGSIGGWLFTILGGVLSVLWLRLPGLYLGSLIILLPLSALCFYRLIVGLRFSCRCYVQTAVSREELPSLMRTWKLEAALERIRAHILEEQGALPDDFRLPDSPASYQDAAPVSVPAFLSEKMDGDPEPYSLAVNLALGGFILCLLDGAASLYFFDGPTLTTETTALRVFNACLTLLQGSFVLIALIKVHKSKALRSLRNLLIAALCFTGGEIYANSLLVSLTTVSRGTTIVRPEMIAFWHGLLWGDSGLALAIGFGGLILILLNWGNFRRGGLSAV